MFTTLSRSRSEVKNGTNTSWELAGTPQILDSFVKTPSPYLQHDSCTFLCRRGSSEITIWNQCWMLMSNISTEASENLFPWIEIYPIVLPLGNLCVISQFRSLFYCCCWLISAANLSSHQQVVKSLTAAVTVTLNLHLHFDKNLSHVWHFKHSSSDSSFFQ